MILFLYCVSCSVWIFYNKLVLHCNNNKSYFHFWNDIYELWIQWEGSDIPLLECAKWKMVSPWWFLPNPDFVAPSYFFSSAPPQLWYNVDRQLRIPWALDVLFPEAAPPQFWVGPGLGAVFISLQVCCDSRLLFANKPKLDSYPVDLGALSVPPWLFHVPVQCELSTFVWVDWTEWEYKTGSWIS